jgi:uncharacterized protein YbaR (Trm112 family)
VLSKIKVSKDIEELFRCPLCRGELGRGEDQFRCVNSECRKEYPIINGIPVLLNEESSVFSISDFFRQRGTYFHLAENKLRKTLEQMLPAISKNIKGKENYHKLVELLISKFAHARALIVGGSIVGQGMEILSGNVSLELVETDVSFGPHTMLICDAHDIPFEDQSFECVILQAVLEHVVDPYRCVEEAYRVLKPEGIVYAETPFIQQVHGRQYDFTRFTYLGHRRLFRKFTEIESGAVCGPGMALAWSYRYFLLSFTTSKYLRALLSAFAQFTSFYLKYFDHYLISKPATLDAASGFYFMGTKGETILSDRELTRLYRGGLS